MNKNRIALAFKCLIALSVIFANYPLSAQTQNEIGISLLRPDIFNEASDSRLIFQPTLRYTTYSGKVGIRGLVSLERFTDYRRASAYVYTDQFNTIFTSIGVSYNPRLGRFQPYPFVDIGVLAGRHSSSFGNGHLQQNSFEKENELGLFLSPGYGLQLQVFSNIIIGIEAKGVFRFSRISRESERYSYPQNVQTLQSRETSIIYDFYLNIISTGLSISHAF